MQVNDQIFVTSINKAVNRAKKTGSFNLTILSIVDIYIYYIKLLDYYISIGMVSLKDKRAELNKNLIALRYKYPSVICNYKNVIPIIGIDTPPIVNTAPTVDTNCVDIGSATSYVFKVEDFTVNYSDAEGHPWKYLMVYVAESMNGAIYHPSGNPIASAIVVNIEGKVGSDSTGITYTRTNTGTYSNDNFDFRISDNPLNYLYSTTTTICINATASTTENQPPSDIGDRTIYVDNRTTTILTLFDFTGGLQAPYNDPEGDLIDAILIVDISNANQGKFYLDGIEIFEGQIITREDINANLFTHVGPNIDSISSDVFEFKARDEGSQIWIE